jgi:hypothetical protein
MAIDLIIDMIAHVNSRDFVLLRVFSACKIAHHFAFIGNYFAAK